MGSLPNAMPVRTLIALLSLCAPAIASAAQVEKSEIPMNEAVPQIPAGPVAARILHCHVRHATNIDPTKSQAEEDIIYSDAADFTLALGAAQLPLATGLGTAQPDTAPPANYHIVTDPQNLFRMAGPRFDRVADYWPKHVEVGKTIMGKAFSFILLDQVPGDPARMTAFVSRAADAVAIDLGWVYRGACRIDD